MAHLDFSLIGSFQRGVSEWSETPLEDLWKRLALMSYPDFLQTAFTADISEEAKASLIAYASVRLRQAQELRTAYRAGTLLTSSLPLYYAFLNLTRGVLALRLDRIPTQRGHGLTYHPSPSLLESAASLREGTFAEWQSALDDSSLGDTRLTLDACLSHIAEIGSDYVTVRKTPPHAIPVRVSAKTSGSVVLTFDESSVGGEAAFHAGWDSMFPSLASCCEPSGEGCALQTQVDLGGDGSEAVARFCAEHLESNLVFSSRPTWYLFRRDGTAPALSRASYYFAATFILSNVTRYEPEALMALISKQSSTAWLLDRFISASERFYPNLLLNWLGGTPWFFGSA